MFKNQLQELAQRSCFNLPSYACIREGPDHAPRFKASVNFNGEIFESPNYSATLRQAEYAAAQVALNALSSSGPSRSLIAKVLDETGVYKNLLQETAHRAGLKLPVYTTVRSGPGHLPVFTSTVELARMNFRGDPAKTKKQAEKNAAIAAWTAFKTKPDSGEPHDQMASDVEVRGVASVRRRPISRHEIRKRYDNHQSRRRLLMRDPATEQQHLMRIVDLICMNSSIEASSSSSTPKQNNCCFVSLLPPPPPKTTPRILPPTPPNFPWPVHLSNSKSEPTTITCSTTSVEMLDEHLRRREEGNEWLDCGGPPSKSSNSSVIPKTDPAFFHSRPIAVTSCTGNLISTSSSEGGRYHHSDSHSYSRIRNRIAPAVHMRSVIPVCAAAPAPPLPPASISKMEVELEAVSLTSSSDTACLSTQRVAEMSMELGGLRLNSPESHTTRP